MDSDLQAVIMSGPSSAPKKQKRRLKSKVHEYFEVTKDGLDYQCCVGNCRQLLTRQTNGSTGNLNNHLRASHPEEFLALKTGQPPKRKKTIQLPAEEEFTREGFLKKLMNFLVSTDQPYSLVENDHFKNLVAYISKDKTVTEVPGRKFITSRITEEYEAKKEEVKKLIDSSNSKVNLVIDGWTSSNQIAFQGVVCRFVDHEFNLQTLALDLTKLDGSHTGANLADSLLPVLEEFGLMKKILAVTTDNAGNMKTFARFLAEKLKMKGIIFDENQQIIKCLAHIVNLAAQTMIKEAGVSDGLKNLREGIRKLRDSPHRRDFYYGQCTEDSGNNLPILDCVTRWDSTYDMIARAMSVKEPLDATLKSILPDNVISSSDWQEVEVLSEILRPLKKTTKKISKQITPNIGYITTQYQALFEHFDDYLQKYTPDNEESSNFKWVYKSLKAGKEKLEEYYGESGGKCPAIGIILHPSYKLKWFKEVHWKRSWISRYRDLVHIEWTKYKKNTTDSDPSQGSSEGSEGLYRKQMSACIKKDELEKYLSEPLVDITTVNKVGLLNWWQTRQTESPQLSQMAKDFLSVSGSGVPAENFFSTATDILTENRQRLTHQHIKELMCLKMWYRNL